MTDFYLKKSAVTENDRRLLIHVFIQAFQAKKINLRSRCLKYLTATETRKLAKPWNQTSQRGQMLQVNSRPRKISRDYHTIGIRYVYSLIGFHEYSYMRTLRSDQGREISGQICGHWFPFFLDSWTDFFLLQPLSAKERNFCEKISFLCLTKPVRVTDKWSLHDHRYSYVSIRFHSVLKLTLTPTSTLTPTPTPTPSARQELLRTLQRGYQAYKMAAKTSWHRSADHDWISHFLRHLTVYA